MSGVVIGTFTLAVSLSLGRGFQDEIVRQLGGGPQLRQVMVWPGSGAKESDIPKEVLEVKGEMSEAKRKRLRKAVIQRWPRPGPVVRLAPARVQALAGLPHVEAVEPIIQEKCQAYLGGRTQTIHVFAASSDSEHFRNRIVAGEYLPSGGGLNVVVGEYLLYQWGLTSDEQLRGVLGKKLRLEYRPRRRAPVVLLRLLRANLDPEEGQALEQALQRLPENLKTTSLPPRERQ